MSKIKNGINYIDINENGVNTEYVFKKIDIGDWDMSVDTYNLVHHNLSLTERDTVTNPQAIIRDDYNVHYLLNSSRGDVYAGGYVPLGSILKFTNISFHLYVNPQAVFSQSGNFTATTYNRGWVTFMYKPD